MKYGHVQGSVSEGRSRRIWRSMRQEMMEHKSTFWVLTVLHALVIVCMIRELYLQHYQSFVLSLLVFMLMYVPAWVQSQFRVSLPAGLEIAILFFIYAAEILGEIDAYYVTVPYWDTMLHTVNGFLSAAIGYSMFFLLTDRPGIELSAAPLFFALSAFCFSMTVGAVWEIAEFTADTLFPCDAQKDTVVASFNSVTLDPTKSNIPVKVDDIADVAVIHSDGTSERLDVGGYLDIGIIDTMKDLSVNLLGALVFSVVGYMYAIGRGGKRMIELFVPSRKQEQTFSQTCDTESGGSASVEEGSASSKSNIGKSE